MDKIKAIAGKLCHFRADSAMKVRNISSDYDVRIWARNLNYENPDCRSRVAYRDPLATFVASTSATETQIVIAPKSLSPMAFISFTIPAAGSMAANLGLQNKAKISRRVKAFGGLLFHWQGSLPDAWLKLNYKHPNFKALFHPIFKDVDGRYLPFGTCNFTVFYETFLAKLAFERNSSENLLGLMLNFRDTRAGFVTSTKEAAYLALETKIGHSWSAGFTCTQIFAMQESIWKVFSATSFGARYSLGPGYINVAWQAPKSLSSKVKYRFRDRYEVAVMARADNYDFSKVSVCCSLCLHPNPSERPMAVERLIDSSPLPRPLPI